MNADPQTSKGLSGLARLIKMRKFGRLIQQRLMSNLGPVLNLSAGGMAVQCRRIPEGEFTVEIIGHPLPEKLRARMIWWRKTGLFKRDVGLQFINVSPEMARRLCAIASSNRLNVAA